MRRWSRRTREVRDEAAPREYPDRGPRGEHPAGRFRAGASVIVGGRVVGQLVSMTAVDGVRVLTVRNLA